jgi:hypothetical protein
LLSADAFPHLDVTPDHPFWNGAFWAVYPKRSGVPGTNDVFEGRVTLKMLWTDRTLEPMNALGQSAALRELLKSVDESRLDSTPIQLSNGAVWHLSGLNGELKVPVIHQHEDDPIHHKGKLIAACVADALTKDPSAQAILGSIPKVNPQEALPIITHEFIWDLIDRLSADGAVHPPRALRVGSDLAPDTLRALVFIVIDH